MGAFIYFASAPHRHCKSMQSSSLPTPLSSDETVPSRWVWPLPGMTPPTSTGHGGSVNGLIRMKTILYAVTFTLGSASFLQVGGFLDRFTRSRAESDSSEGLEMSV